MKKSIPETYKVGGRRVKRPTGLLRDSSLRIVKAPGKMLSCREAQTVTPNIGTHAAMRHGNATVRATIFAGYAATCLLPLWEKVDRRVVPRRMKGVGRSERAQKETLSSEAPRSGQHPSSAPSGHLLPQGEKGMPRNSLLPDDQQRHSDQFDRQASEMPG